MQNNPRWIVIHTAAADRTGVTMEEINRWHKQRGFRCIGYHFVIEDNGDVRLGRKQIEPGAHAVGLNKRSIGICVTGHGDHFDFSEKQYTSLFALVHALCEQYRIDASGVIGHREAHIAGAPKTTKTCPGTMVDCDRIRSMIRGTNHCGKMEGQ